jgi:hypothetical protein
VKERRRLAYLHTPHGQPITLAAAASPRVGWPVPVGIVAADQQIDACLWERLQQINHEDILSLTSLLRAGYLRH